MVGVPGRSKGCNTCRRRRVKCDETKPVCIRCTKAGVDCTGYQRGWTWHNTSTVPLPESMQTNEAGLETSSRPLTAVYTSRPSGTVIAGTRRAQAPQRATDMPPTIPSQATTTGVLVRSRHSGMDRTQSPPPELSLVGFKGDFCFAFMFSNFVWRGYGAPWLEQAASGELGHLSLDAVKALAETNFGRSNSKTDIEIQGLTLYGRCLKSIAVNLTGIGDQDRRHQRKQFLVPVLLLLMQSASNSDRAASASHLRGIAHLLQASGPEAFQEQPYLNAFEAARATLVVAGLVSKQRLFLAEEAWLTVPWALNQVYKTPQSELLDILMAVPGILQDHAVVENSPQATVRDTEISDVLSQVHAQLIALYTWRWRWQQTSRNSVGVDCMRAEEGLSAQNPEEASGSTETPRHRQRLRFTRFSSAMEIMLYNAAVMWLIALLWKLDPFGAAKRIETCAKLAYSSFGSSNSGGKSLGHMSFAPLRRPGGAVSVVDPAMEICQVFEWVSRHHSRSREPAFLYLFPMGMAMSVLMEKGSQDHDAAWARSLLDANPITANYAQASNPAGFGFYLTPESLNPDEVHAQQRLFPCWEMGSRS